MLVGGKEQGAGTSGPDVESRGGEGRSSPGAESEAGIQVGIQPAPGETELPPTPWSNPRRRAPLVVDAGRSLALLARALLRHRTRPISQPALPPPHPTPPPSALGLSRGTAILQRYEEQALNTSDAQGGARQDLEPFQP